MGSGSMSSGTSSKTASSAITLATRSIARARTRITNTSRPIEADQPEVHQIIAEMRRVLDAYPRRMMVGEVYLPVERLVTYYGQGGSGRAHAV